MGNSREKSRRKRPWHYLFIVVKQGLTAPGAEELRRGSRIFPMLGQQGKAWQTVHRAGWGSPNPGHQAPLQTSSVRIRSDEEGCAWLGGRELQIHLKDCCVKFTLIVNSHWNMIILWSTIFQDWKVGFVRSSVILSTWWGFYLSFIPSYFLEIPE